MYYTALFWGRQYIPHPVPLYSQSRKHGNRPDIHSRELPQVATVDSAQCTKCLAEKEGFYLCFFQLGLGLSLSASLRTASQSSSKETSESDGRLVWSLLNPGEEKRTLKRFRLGCWPQKSLTDTAVSFLGVLSIPEKRNKNNPFWWQTSYLHPALVCRPLTRRSYAVQVIDTFPS